jgi:hypothetical protein
MDGTARVDREAPNDEILDEIGGIVARARESADLRELRVQADKLRRVVTHWSAARPEGSPIRAMQELVTDLYIESSPAARSRRGVMSSPFSRARSSEAISPCRRSS